MIIFGFRSFVKSLAVLTLICRKCQHRAAHRVVQRSRWFTLFFVPLIPLSFTRFTTCTMCAASYKISKENAQQMIAAANGSVGPAAEQLPAPSTTDQS